MTNSVESRVFIRKFKALVDQSEPVSETIRRCGFDEVHSDVLWHFAKEPLGDGVQEIELQVVRFSEQPASEYIAAEMLAHLGLRPATLQKLVAFAAAYREEQEIHIMAFGSRWEYQSWLIFYPTLGRWVKPRALAIQSFHHLPEDVCFLAEPLQ